MPRARSPLRLRLGLPLCWHWLTRGRTPPSRPNHASSIRTGGSCFLLCPSSSNTQLWSSLAHGSFSGENDRRAKSFTLPLSLLDELLQLLVTQQLGRYWSPRPITLYLC